MSKKPVLNSLLAVQILAYIHHNPRYTKEIAEYLEKRPQSVSRVLSQLKEINAVKVARRTQAKYYETDIEGIAEFTADKLRNQLSDSDRFSEIFDDNRDEIENLLTLYYDEVFELIKEDDILRVSSTNLEYLLFGSLEDQLQAIDREKEKHSEVILPLEIAVSEYYDKGTIPIIFDRILDEFES